MGRASPTGALVRERSAAVIVRQPAVAGLFYPEDPVELAALVDDFLACAPRTDGGAPPKAIVAPHAGLIYSGPIAASAYRSIACRRDEVTRVIVLGPAHTVPLRGVAASSADAFRTPLGDVRVQYGRLPGVLVVDAAHEREHCIEVQLPFLQRTLGEFELVPLVVGACELDTVVDVLDACWGGAETLVVVSTDLSHYESPADAALHDRATAAAIVSRRPAAIGERDACGRYALRALVREAELRDLDTELLDLRSSGDTAGPRDRVVGYGAFAFREPAR
ncbi:MAG TPA: AmmeMemoRadiSam system protein B [Acidimicrobiia bacterium]|nr:AmmeMemoRadiSam system protein B [Acidimicrobiia bacterium]